MSKFAGWLAGILAAVIGGWLVWYLTRPVLPTIFEGMVYDSAANVPVANAMVVLQIEGMADEPSHSATNENGSYKLRFIDLKKSSRASIQVTAKGFDPFTVPSFAVGEDNRHDAPLTPQKTNRPGGNVPILHLPAESHVLKYIPKPDAEATEVRIQPKP
jgi:Carboxypeptidase regulatory-like domain